MLKLFDARLNVMKSRSRKIIELLGLGLLALGVYSGRSVLAASWQTVKTAQGWPLLVCFGLAWTDYLWSALGYKILVGRGVRLYYICLAHLAAGGPGRVIPGGAGHVSFGTIFLQKQGLKLPRALAISLTNNFIGFAVNISVLLVIFASHPANLNRLHVSARNLVLVASVLAAAAAIFLVMRRRSARFKKGSTQTSREFRRIAQRITSRPLLGLLLICTMLATITTNTLVLFFAARSIHMPLSVIDAFIAMSTGAALGSLVPTPGGIGGVEAGITAGLYTLGYNLEMATSAALLFRAATYLQPFLPGIASYLWLRRKKLL